MGFWSRVYESYGALMMLGNERDSLDIEPEPAKLVVVVNLRSVGWD